MCTEETDDADDGEGEVSRRERDIVAGGVRCARREVGLLALVVDPRRGVGGRAVLNCIHV